MGNKSLFPVVAVPPAFFGTFFRFERKYVPLRGGSPTVRAGVGASIRRSRRVNPPESVSFRQSWRTLMLTVGFPLAPCSPLDRLPVQINNPMELQVPPRAVVGASAPSWGMLPAKSTYTDTDRGSSSGQTTGAACTVVCSACCLAERRAVPLGNLQNPSSASIRCCK